MFTFLETTIAQSVADYQVEQSARLVLNQSYTKDELGSVLVKAVTGKSSTEVC